jgi:hypothetical protein
MSGDWARLYVFEAYIETLKAENAILKRQLAAAETRTARAAPVATSAESEPRRSLLRYWFGWA